MDHLCCLPRPIRLVELDYCVCVRAFCHSMVVLGFRVCLSAADSSDSSLKWTTAARPVRQGAVWAAPLILAGRDLLLASRKR
jgi:hypothetical protein